MDEDEIILQRVHRFLQARKAQLELNALAADGGAEYVKRRLWRGVNESNLSWDGELNDNGTWIPGRREKTFNQNDAGRVALKIEQYIFSESAQRAGADQAFLDDVTGTRIGAHGRTVGLGAGGRPVPGGR